MNKFYVYILYSAQLDKHYVGQTSLEPDVRLQQHNSGDFEDKFTLKGIPWTLFLTIDCNSRTEALKIEAHIKKMKSVKYVNSLKEFPEIITRLKAKFADP